MCNFDDVSNVYLDAWYDIVVHKNWSDAGDGRNGTM